jgi:anti-anti-sigma regulatory factor
MNQMEGKTIKVQTDSLLVRERCKLLKKKILNLILSSAEQIYYLDLTELQHINVQGVESFIAELIRDCSTEKKYIVLLIRDNEFEHALNINRSLTPLKLAVIARVDDQLIVLGHLPHKLKKLMSVIYEKNNITAAQLSNITGMNFTLCSTHLAKLSEMNLLRRVKEKPEKGNGYQYVYYPLIRK